MRGLIAGLMLGAFFWGALLWPPRGAAFWVLELQSAAFVYQPTAETLSPPKRYEKPSRDALPETGLTHWSQPAGSSPEAFRIRVDVRHYGDEPSQPVPVVMLLWARVGDYLLHPTTLLVDHDHLQETARWEPVGTLTGTIPPLAPMETHRFLSPAIAFSTYLATLKDRHPVMLKAVIHLKNPEKAIHGDTQIMLPVTPGHFKLDTVTP